MDKFQYINELLDLFRIYIYITTALEIGRRHMASYSLEYSGI